MTLTPQMLARLAGNLASLTSWQRVLYRVALAALTALIRRGAMRSTTVRELAQMIEEWEGDDSKDKEPKNIG